MVHLPSVRLVGAHVNTSRQPRLICACVLCSVCVFVCARNENRKHALNESLKGASFFVVGGNLFVLCLTTAKYRYAPVATFKSENEHRDVVSAMHRKSACANSISK